MGGRKSKSKPVVLPLTETDKKLQQIALEFSGRQLGVFGDTAAFSQALFGKAREGLAGLNVNQLQDNPAFQAAQQAELSRIQGGGISPEQRAAIQGAAENQLGILGSDINQFAGSQREALVRDLTPGLGLRPTDTTIQDRGFQIGSEATRQYAQGARAIRGQALEAELTLPFQSAQANQSLLGLQGSLASQDFQNRLSLASGASSTGLGLAAPSDIASTTGAVKAPKVAGQKEQSSGGGVVN